MTLLAGWINTSIRNQDTELLMTQIIKQLPEYLKKQSSVEFAGTASLAGKTGEIFKEHGCLLINTGQEPIADKAKDYLQIFKQKGSGCVEQFSGRYSFVLINPEQQTLILVTDSIGKNHIYYAQTKNGLVIGSSADIVIAHPEVKDDISAQSVFDYVYFHHCPSPNTIYTQVKKLENGQALVYDNGQIKLHYYWQPEFTEQLHCSVAEAGTQLQEKLIEAVKTLSKEPEKTGAFLSGGLDSSSVAGALSKVYPKQAQSFTMGFPVEGYDEIEYARIAVKHFDLQPHEFYLTPEDTVKAIPEIAAYYDEPFGNSSALAAYYCAKMAKEQGIDVLLAGDGGDELFAGNERYAKQLLFDYYHKVPKPLATALESILNGLPSSLAQNKLLFKAKRYIEQAKEPMPDRLQDYNFLHRHDVKDIFQADFLQSVQTEEPLNLLRSSYQRPENASTLNRMLIMDWKTTLHDNDLVKVNRMSEMAGVDVRYPLLDQEIIYLSTHIPSDLKLKGQQLRWFYKQAFKDFLPEQIINKSKHGFGLPFGIWLKDYQPLKELAYDSINSLKKRHYFKSEFLEHAIEMHQSIHAAYYGELIWILMMLELWFQGKKQ